MNARGRITVLAVILLIAQVFLAGGSVLAKPLPATSAQLTATPELTQAAQPLTWPTFGRGAVGAVGYDGVLAEHGDQGRVPIASVTKTVTALVVLEKMPIAEGEQGPSITLTDADVEIYNQVIAQNGSSARVVVGATLTQRQMLEALMLPSANNYSIMLADWAYGSLEKFLEAANNWLTAKGLTDTWPIRAACRRRACRRPRTLSRSASSCSPTRCSPRS
jgi:D-alanyl-D-alanine carboxypeptidase (penicillin-binding protein 5/6)